MTHRHTNTLVALALLAMLLLSCSEPEDTQIFHHIGDEFSIEYPAHWKTDEGWKNAQTNTFNQVYTSFDNEVVVEIPILAGVKQGQGMLPYFWVQKDVYNPAQWEAENFGPDPEWPGNLQYIETKRLTHIVVEISEAEYSFENGVTRAHWSLVSQDTPNSPQWHETVLVVNNTNISDRAIWKVVCLTKRGAKQDISDCAKLIQSYEQD